MPSGWTADYSGDAAFHEGTATGTYTYPNGSDQIASQTVKQVALDEVDIAAGFSPTDEKYVVFHAATALDTYGPMLSGGTLVVGSVTYSVLAVSTRNDETQTHLIVRRQS